MATKEKIQEILSTAINSRLWTNDLSKTKSAGEILEDIIVDEEQLITSLELEVLWTATEEFFAFRAAELIERKKL